MTNGGYTRKLLRIDLSKESFNIEEIPDNIIEQYLGGAGFGIKYLLDEVPADTDPLSEKNKLFFSCGPLAGTDTPCASRISVVSKSPLTGAVGMCMSGGHFPAEMKFAGFDMIVIEGKSEKPKYLYIKNGKVTFKDAKHLWGTTTIDCQQIIKDELHDQSIRIACIGPAGENLSRISCIINERRAAGRKGLGAVMGSKNLKAIALVEENREVAIADKEAYKAARSNMLKAMKESPVLYPEFSKYGTPMTLDVAWGLGIYPTKNFMTTGAWAPVEELGTAANEAQKIGAERCYQCPVGCSQMKIVKKGRYAGIMSVPEFETLYSLGGNTGMENLDAVIAGDRICDEQGMDTISAGVVIGFAMELYEKGILTKEDTDGIDLKFGNDDAMLQVLVKMAQRDGIGDLLADGVKRVAEKIGKGSEKFAVHVKGLELPGYDVRGAKAHGLSMATSYTGADHNRGYAFQEVFSIPVPYPVDRFEIKGKGALTKWNQDYRSVTCDCAPMCAFLMDMALPGICAENTASLVNGAAGTQFTPESVAQIGERVNNIARIYNICAGFTRQDDHLPPRIMNEPLTGGSAKGQHVPLEDMNFMLDEYYDARGWTKDGVPTEDKLKELGLEGYMPLLKAKGAM